MGCGDEKLSKSLTQTFTAHCNAMICQRVTLPGDDDWPKVADAVIEAVTPLIRTRTVITGAQGKQRIRRWYATILIHERRHESRESGSYLVEYTAEVSPVVGCEVSINKGI